MSITLKRWNIADELETEEDLQLYISSLLEDVEDDPVFVAQALADIAEAKGLNKVIEQLGLKPQENPLENNNPSFTFILKMLKALGFMFEVKPIPKLSSKREGSYV